MRHFRVNEPSDPALRGISKVLPDRWIDEQWPMRRYCGVTRWKEWCTSQMVRLHLLTLIKGVGSFNAICRGLAHNTDYRRFCRIRRDCLTPAAGTLSKFREDFGQEGWRRLLVFLITKVVGFLEVPGVGVFVVDSTDLPAAVRRTWKKKRILLGRSA